MWARILGTIWVLLGILWTLKPEMLRRRLIKKTNRKLRWVVYGFILAFVFSLLGMVIKAQGLWLKIGGLLAIFFAVKVTFSVIANAAEKTTGFWSAKPLNFFRIWGLVVLVSGILLILTR